MFAMVGIAARQRTIGTRSIPRGHARKTGVAARCDRLGRLLVQAAHPAARAPLCPLGGQHRGRPRISRAYEDNGTSRDLAPTWNSLRETTS
jgi:hypothetical protein